MQQLEFCKLVKRAQENADPNRLLENTEASKPVTKFESCYFSGVKEQTPVGEEDLPFDQEGSRPPKKTMKVYCEENRLRVVTKGGSEFVSNVRHKVAQIFPLDDGLILKAIFNADLYAFELGGRVTNHGVKPKHSQSRETYVYLALLDHPLDDATPVAFESADIQLINTPLELVHASQSFPIVVLHDPGQSETRFCLNKRTPESSDVEMNAENEANVRQQLPSLIGASKVMFQTVFTERTQRPDQVIVTGHYGEITICLFFPESKTVNIYSCNLQRLDRAQCFKKIQVQQNVIQMVPLQFTGSLESKQAGIVPREFVGGLKQSKPIEGTVMKALRKRLESMAVDVALLTYDGQLTVYSHGRIPVHRVNLNEQLAQHGYGKLSIKSLATSHETPSIVQIEVSDGRSLSLEVSLTSTFLITSVMEVLRSLIPEDSYSTVLQELVSLMTTKPDQVDYFETFADMLLCLMSDRSSVRLTKPSYNDFVSYLAPKKEETKQEKPSKVFRMSSTKIKPISSATTDKRIATISVPSVKTSPTKVSQKPQSKIQVKKMAKPESPGKEEYSSAVIIPNAFELMLASDFCQGDSLFKSLIGSELADANKISSNNLVQQQTSPLKVESSVGMLKDQALEIFRVLHLLHEDLKLRKYMYSVQAKQLRKLLYALALQTEKQAPASLKAYLAYYSAEDPALPKLFAKELKAQKPHASDEIEQVPQILAWITDTLAGNQTSKFPIFFTVTRIICRLYEILTQQHQSYFLDPNPCDSVHPQISNLLFHQKLNQSPVKLTQSVRDYLMLGGSPLGSLHLFEKVLYCLKEEQFATDMISQLPDIVSLPVIEVIRYTRLFQQDIQTVQAWPSSLYRLIRREDIISNLKLFEKGQPKAVDEPKLVRQGSKNFAFSRRDSNVFSEQQESKLTSLQNQYVQDLIGEEKNQDQAPYHKTEVKESVIQEFIKNRFGADTCYKEAEHLLSSQVDMVLKLDSIMAGSIDQIALNEEERQRRQKLQLEKLFSRHLSKCVGRGALSLGTQETLPTETLLIPKISQQGLVLNPNDQTETLHGQTISVNLDAREQREVLQWPSFHNGVATALKISPLGFKRNKVSDLANPSNLNHARDWIMFHKPQEPKNEHGGFLLGIGLLGQLDLLRPTDLYQHLKSAHDSTTIGILLGRAVSQIGKMDDADSRTMCLHIPSLLPQNLSVEISLPVQSAAVIGAGLLYQQTQNRLMTEMLLSQIGRKPSSDKMIDREGYALAAGIALGLVNLAKDSQQLDQTAAEKNPFNHGVQFSELSDLRLDDRLIRFIEGGQKMPLPRSMAQMSQNADQSKSSAIKENDQVNVYVTSSGALFALTLIYLKSNNRTIADRLQVPDSFYAMEFVRPVALLQKVLCRNLIMWDQIAISQEWIKSNIPPIIQKIYESDMETIDLEFNKRCSSKEIDFATVALCYINIIAGATFSIGFKYAGTGNRQAKELIESQILFFRKQLKAVTGSQPLGGPIQTNTTAQTKNQVDRATVETCLCVLALSLGMVMAGKCDVGCFRTMRILRKRFEAEMHYGYNMAINLAIGFLFLGSGAYTFSRSNQAIAALLCATYPIFPQTPSDNRHHLQALRHFYVLAIETRLLQARDIDTGNFVNIEVLVTLEDDASQQVRQITYRTPEIINGKILRIEVKDAQYHDVSLNIEESDTAMQIDNLARDLTREQTKFEQTALQRIIYVKRKNLVEKENPGENCDELAVALRQRAEGEEECEMARKAALALQSVQAIKDQSVEAFMVNFASSLFKDEKFSKVRPISDVNLELCMSSIHDVLIANQTEQSYESSVLTHSIMKDLEDLLYDRVEVKIYQQHYTTLLALNDCLANDKIASLPLLLQLSTQKPAYFLTLLHSYSAFMHRSRTRGYFKRFSDTVPRSLLNAIGQNGSRQLDPCLAKALLDFIHQVLQQASEMYEHATIEAYIKNAQKGIATEGEVHQLVLEALKTADQDETVWRDLMMQ